MFSTEAKNWTCTRI